MSGGRVDIKVVLLGMEHVGKTALVERILHERFTGTLYQSTIGAAYGAKRLQSTKGRDYVVGIWDTAGSERYEAMSRIYYRGAKAAIVCYDVCDTPSFRRLEFWVSELMNNEESCRIYLCGCKKDLLSIRENKRGVDFQTIQAYSNEITAKLFETSSKTGEGIHDLLQTIIDDITDDPSFNPQPSQHTLTLERIPPKPKKSCKPCQSR